MPKNVRDRFIKAVVVIILLFFCLSIILPMLSIGR